MPIQANPDLLLAAFVDECREIGGSTPAALAFAKNLRRAALIGTSTAIADVLAHAQDYTSGSISAESSSTQWMREMTALALATLCQAAVERFQAEIEATAAGLTGNSPAGNISYADFSQSPSILG
jgi:hypothetical protein